MNEINNAASEDNNRFTGLEIAVIGMSGRFPGAKNIDEFWENIKNGVESISFFTDQELLEYGIDPGWLADPNYVKAKGVLEGIELFDASFFGYNHNEARMMDPQIRLMHEATVHVLEDAGYDPESYMGAIGLYIGASTDANWLAQSVLTRGMDNLELFDNVMYGHKDLVSTMVSYRLNLKGPSYSIYTACSTSLAAIHLSCRALLTGECRMAVAGGVTVTLPKKFGYFCKEGMIYSPDGHCRPFDARACGTLFGDGIGLVLLKRLEDALADGDRINAVIKSSAANNDGRRKVGYVAPSSEGQSEVIKAALFMAEIEPESIGFIECHGTGTSVGDPIEIEGLCQAFNTDKKQFCAVASVKANVGHLHAAAGVAGFIKAVMVVKNEIIPPAVNFEIANPKIDFENSPFYVNTELRQWKNNGLPLRAGVSSFGIGGTNIHIILEEAPKQPRENESDPVSRRSQRLIFLSAKSEISLDLASGNLADYLTRTPFVNLDDAAYTLQVGRRAFKHRKMVVCSDKQELIEKLSVNENKALVQQENNPVIFMFSGQGSQYVNMGLELYRTEKTYRDDINHCFHLLGAIIGENCRQVLYPDAGNDGLSEHDKEKINEFKYTSPVKFIFEYALARLLISWGITPTAMIGHSFGEYSAACLSGVLSLEDALKLTALRGELFHELGEGLMVSVSIPEDRLMEILKENRTAEKVSIAAVNGVSQCLISGPCDLVGQTQAQLEAAGYECARVRVPRAAHSPEMKPIIDKFRKALEQVTFNKPAIPYISGLSGEWIKNEEAEDPSYYCRHLLETIRFFDGLTELLKNENAVFIQVGSDRSLNTFVNQHPGKKIGHSVFNLIRHPKDAVSDVRFLIDKIGLLWLNGIKLDWKAFYAGQHRSIISLPGYAFEPVAYFSKAFYSSKIAGAQVSGAEKEEDENIPADFQISSLAFKRPELKNKFEPPRTADEQAIAEVWQAVFGVREVGIYDNFFELGGDSLIALNTISKINKKLDTNISVSVLFVNPTIAELAWYIDTNESPIQKIQYQEKTPDLKNLYLPFPLTDIQLSYLIGRHGSFEMGGISTHAYQEIETQLDIIQLTQSLNKVIRRHPMLRTIFIGDNQQMILKEVPDYAIHIDDLCHLNSDTQQEIIKKERTRMAHFIFLPDRWPLFEIKGFKTSVATHYLCIGMDMLIADGASIGILVRDLLNDYEGKDNEFPVLEFSFRDYILAYEELKASDIYRVDKEYWLNKLEDFPLSPSLPLKCNPADIAQPRFKRHRKIFSAVDWEKLKSTARSKNITPSTFLSTAYAEVLSYWSNQPRMAFNLTVFNRYPFHEDVNQIIGDFTSVILLGIDFTCCAGFWEKAAVVQRELFEALAHRHYDGVEFIRELARYHGMAGKAVMPIIFTSAIFNSEVVALTAINRLGTLKEGISQTPQVFIDFQAGEMDGGLVITWDFVEELFETEIIDAMFTQFVLILSQILAGDNTYRLTPPHETVTLIDRYNRTKEDLPVLTLHQMVVNQAKRNPTNTAIEFRNDSITYKELDERSDRMARYLVEKGIKRNELVAVLAHRCIESIINILGILKSGGAYVPIDPDYPRDRQDYIYTNSNCRIMITPGLYRDENLSKFPAGELENVNFPDDLAYVIYTSGSTGKPKGVIETHREVANTVIDINRKFAVNDTDKILGISSLCFDLSVYDVFGALSTGATLVLISSQKDVKEIIETLYEKKITIWNSVPAILDMTIENIDFYLKKEQPPAATKNEPVDSIEFKLKKDDLGAPEEKVYYWSPAMYWKKQKNKLRIDKHYFDGVALEVFPDLYFLTQDGITLSALIKKFPNINSATLQPLIDELIEKRILVSSILSPEEVFHPQTRLFENTFTEEILYNESVYNQYKKFQLTRTYPGAGKEKIQLQEDCSFPGFIKDRRSYREFEKKPVPFVIFSRLLTIFKQTHDQDIRYYYASAGGLYPIDIFVYIKKERVENINMGLYYYNPMEGSLSAVEKNLVIDEDIHFMGNKQIFHSSAFTIFMVYNAEVTMPKYRNNGYFYALIDCGIIVGTLTQAAELLGIGLCSVGSLNFQKIRNHFKLNDNQVLVHSVELGLKPGYTTVSNEIFQDPCDIKVPGRNFLPGLRTGKTTLRLIMLSGDWIPLNLPAKLTKYFPGADIISLGGATEGSIWSIYYPIKEVKSTWKSIPYGYPLANQRFYVLDFQGRFCPSDVPGELYIGGAGVAEGYWGDNEKTAASFIRHESLGRLYRTGDFGVFRSPGFIEFLGRRDSQVKIRGYRIELGEIETRILEIDFVKEAVVIVKDHAGSKRLCAFVVLHPGYPDAPWSQVIDKLRKLLSERLPDYMVPSSFIQLQQIPVNSTGKIDRKKLAEYEIELQDSKMYMAPGNDVEKKLAEIFTKILAMEKVGVTDNFFHLGGDSLKAIAAVTEIRKQMNIDLPLQDIFVYLTISDLAAYISAEFKPVFGEAGDFGRKLTYLTAETDWENIHEPFDLSHIQRAYVLGRYNYFEMGGTSTHAYQEIEAAVDIERLNQSLNKVIRRHPMLRCVILDDSSQKILDEIPEYQVVVADFRGSDAVILEQAIQKERQRMSHHIFKIDSWPLFEIKAFRLTNETYYLFIGFDLVIGDAASVHILNTELAAFYLKPELELPELQFTFRDYILAYENIKNLDVYDASKKYWMSQVEDFPHFPRLPFKCNPSEIANPRFKRLAKFFSPSEWEKLKSNAEKRNLTNAVVLCTAYAEVMAYWSNQPQLALNLPVFNRYPFHKDVNRLIGDFTSVVLLKINFNPGDNFWKKAEKVKITLMEALEHRYYDGVEFIRELARRDSAGGRALMPIVFTSLFLDIKDDSLEHAPKIGEKKMSISQTSQVFIDCQIISIDGGLNVNWDYVRELFDEDLIAAMFDHFTKLIESIIQEEENYVFQYGEKEIALLEAYNDTDEDFPANTLHGLFTSRAALFPDRTAVEFLDKRITYNELDERSNRVARFLREQGVKANDLVGLIGDRCIDTIVNVIGILKAGGAYVPVDPDYPEDRKTYIFQSSNCMLTLSPDIYLSKKLAIYSPKEIDNINTPDDLAYVIYTSGSTGRPKGVIETHRASGNTIIDINRKFAVDETDRIMGISSLCFDLSVYDIFGVLAAGAVLVLIKTPKDIPHMIQTLDNKKITLWNSVPAIMDLAVEELPHDYINHQLKNVMLSGDWIPLNLPGKIKRYFPDAKTFSLGGATEASIWSIYYHIEEVKTSWKSIPYGIPLANQEFYVLDYAMRLCPREVAGELYIGGIGLASGYLNDVEKTAAGFIQHPQLGNLYRTGDQGVLHKEGYIEFLGRKDQQIKIKGHRIELGEIENQLLKQEGVKEAIILVKERESNDRYLCAYVVPGESVGKDYSQDLRKNLSQVLPTYMIPSHIILLEEMPLTANGKIDRKNLPGPETSLPLVDLAYEEAETEIEKMIVEICNQVAQLNRIGVNDNLFELGVTSLDVAKINAKLRNAFKIPLPIVKMFEYSTVRTLAEYIGNEMGINDGVKETAQDTVNDEILKEQTMDKGKDRLKQRRKRSNMENPI